MPRYRIQLHNHIIEARYGNFSASEVLLDGRPVRRRWLDAFLDRPIRFDLTDESGRSRAVEVRWVASSKHLGLKYRVHIAVDGLDRAILEPEPDHAAPGRCYHCGYTLAGLSPDNGEIRCPECGRHTPARFAGLV